MVTELRYRSLLVVVFVTLSLVLACVPTVRGQTGDMEKFFSAGYAGVSINVYASPKTDPGGNMTIEVMINATAENVWIEYLNVSVYGFISGTEQILLNSSNVMSDEPLQFHQMIPSNITIVVPADVWGITYGQILLRYSFGDYSTERGPGFPLTTVRNVYLEDLESRFRSLTQSHSLLSESFRNLTIEFDRLNQSYTELQGNYSQLQGRIGDLDNTRTVAVILTITTVFFVATTFYLVMRRPKEYW